MGAPLSASRLRAKAPRRLDGDQMAHDFWLMADDDPRQPKRSLSPAAQRALEEAAQRRAATEKLAKPAAKEVGGAVGPEPTRYGDWEKKGLASDF
jgi:hypothetical protein